ncbi:TANK-binding kinase 1-binding protein 1 [Liparis tanakae]|uniref:TANK-binding kinase 1-binding protein 1 n=1 Tax=Liparis tanakae TaxID=230148 RepID=A0A4Z2GG08_9TELE|nr:TANK-binding kinase 1-binding protein 1 [Liparis tanakae]
MKNRLLYNQRSRPLVVRRENAHSKTPPLIQGHHLRHLDDQQEPSPLVTPPPSSDDEEDVRPYPSPVASPLRAHGAVGSPSPREPPLHRSFSSPREPPPQRPSFSPPEGAATLRRLPAYMTTEHAQSWPSINLWMESEESAARSCPLCQLTFPTGYPDDALIKHIDSHLENSKI